jgi:hypothetical membrane protein
VGAWAWLLAVQFFVAQAIVAAAWTTPYSLIDRYISDLGNTVCGPYPADGAVVVCSPWHATMNLSFALLGVTMATGGVCAARAFAHRRLAVTAAALFVVAGVGVALVGYYPENENAARHARGAGVNFVTGGVAVVLFGLAWRGPRASWVRPVSVVAGVLALAGTWLFASDVYLGLGAGGMERVAAYPVPLWQMMMGWVLWSDRPRTSR